MLSINEGYFRKILSWDKLNLNPNFRSKRVVSKSEVRKVWKELSIILTSILGWKKSKRQFRFSKTSRKGTGGCSAG